MTNEAATGTFQPGSHCGHFQLMGGANSAPAASIVEIWETRLS